ncbi:MAG: hypothetical protein DI626_01830 [Micavibrio aeruginosavorus]|uniref:Uncharacterized protein n=1 Tax=Micavibrio aeruginosavorus TaxID=349221 RepID=A0A2W5A551_9BACT|nr:MAG: hypothetical protein DI626_01830 [Micavibrio aeruginosavorus]
MSVGTIVGATGFCKNQIFFHWNIFKRKEQFPSFTFSRNPENPPETGFQAAAKSAFLEKSGGDKCAFWF